MGRQGSGLLVVPSDKADALGSIEVAGSASASPGGRQRSTGAGTGRTIVIGMSATGSNNDDKAAQAGMDGFLVKPFRLDEMMGIITARANANGAGGGIANGRRSGSGHFNVTTAVSGAGSASVGL